MKLKKENLRNLVKSALFLALTFLGTLISIPSPIGGNVNLGDGFLLIGSALLGLPWCLASALGAALCDLIGYVIYAPATLVIKLGSAFLAAFLPRMFPKRNDLLRYLIAAILAELWMALGYYCYEGFLLGSFAAPLLNIPLNLIQGAFAVILLFLFLKSRKKRS